MDKLKLAYDYITACQVQSCYENKIDQAFQLLNPDNTVFGLADPLRQPYEELVSEILGEPVMDWIHYWQYEADYGSESRDFTINDVEYNTQDMTLYKYLEVTCGLTK
jgi:carboxypeptidase C (cathepsin A)